MFQANCAVCHRANGAGTPGLAPPVTVFPPRFIAVPEGRRQLVQTVLFGMYGDIVVAERHYNFKMPDFTRLDDATLAAALNFVVFDLAHAAAELAPLTAAEVAAERGEVAEAMFRGAAERGRIAETMYKAAVARGEIAEAMYKAAVARGEVAEAREKAAAARGDRAGEEGSGIRVGSATRAPGSRRGRAPMKGGLR